MKSKNAILRNTRFIKPIDWKPSLIEPLRFGNNPHRLSGFVRFDGTGGKPLYPADADAFEDKLCQKQQKARDGFKGLSLWRFHVHMPLLTAGQQQLNPLYTFIKAPLRLSSTSITVLLIDRKNIMTADMGFYYNGKTLPTLRQRLAGTKFKGVVANLGYYMTESLITDGYPWSHNIRYPGFPTPPMPAYLGFYYFRHPGSKDVMSTFDGAHPAAVGIKQSGEIKIIPRLGIDHYQVALDGKTIVIKSINSSDASADVIAFTPNPLRYRLMGAPLKSLYPVASIFSLPMRVSAMRRSKRSLKYGKIGLPCLPMGLFYLLTECFLRNILGIRPFNILRGKGLPSYLVVIPTLVTIDRSWGALFR